MDREQNSSSQRKTQKDYSLVFKLHVVNEVEKGFLTYKQAQKKYGIQGRSTVLQWLRKHGNLNWQEGMIVNKENTPYKEIQELKAKIKQLEKEKKILNTAIDVADEMLSTDIRKKYLALSLEQSKRRSQK